MADHSPKDRKSTAAFAGSAFEQYRAALQHFLMLRLHSAENAQDLAQEVYLRLLRVENAELVRKPQAYLYRIASHVVYEFRMRERNEPVDFDSEAVEQQVEHPPNVSPGEISDRLDAERRLERVLAQLPPTYRAVLLMKKRDGWSYLEIARALGISVHTVKKYLVRAVAQCRAADWDQ